MSLDKPVSSALCVVAMTDPHNDTDSRWYASDESAAWRLLDEEARQHHDKDAEADARWLASDAAYAWGVL